MARLILLGGAPGVGKSTIARRLTADRPLALLLDIDVVRSWLGDDGPDVTPSFLAARALALAMAGTHLRAGHDVVVPQYLGRPEFIAQLRAEAERAGAEFVELVLVVERRRGQERFDERGDVPQLVGTNETYAEMHERLERLLTGRTDVVRIDANGDLDATSDAVRAALAWPRAGAPRSG